MTRNRFIPHTPTPRQALFLAATEIEAFYGGAAGGGKSDALLMSALQFVDVPNYSALLLRKTFADLNQPNSLIPRSLAWLGGTDARWSGSEHAWHFPSGAVIKFGYLDTEMDVYQYQSAEFQTICFDELTQFREKDFRYLFSRLRKTTGLDVPLRMRAGSNPGGMGHDWVKQRYLIEGRKEGRIFVPAKLPDNPHIDRDTYMQSLSHLDPITRAQLERGDWTAKATGKIFRREWFKMIEHRPRWAWDGLCRFWDLAATAEEEGGDPAWTAGVLLGLHAGGWYVLDVRRMRGSPMQVEELIAQTAALDPDGTRIRMEQEPGSGGKNTIANYALRVLVGRDFIGVPSTRDKVTRAAPVSSAAESRNVYVLKAPWTTDFLDEVESFPDGKKDQVDALSGAFTELSLCSPVMLA